MAEKGVIVEFDFAAMNGAEILFETTKAFLQKLDGIPFDARIEAEYMAGGNYQGALAGYFSFVKTKKTPQKAAKDLTEAFEAALNAAVVKSISPGFCNFVTRLVDAGAKVVISTRANLDVVGAAFSDILSDRAVLYHEESTTYGAVKWDAWRRACVANKLRSYFTLAVAGSGIGVKSALFAGLPVIGVVNPHVAYQDFSGADEVMQELNAHAAQTAIDILRLD